jgi:hypothetical protein
MPISVRISIPAIGVNAPIVRLGLNPDQTIQVPTNFAGAGWFRPGPEPGEVGAAVVVGQLASLRGPGVFCRARIKLRPTLAASPASEVLRGFRHTGRCAGCNGRTCRTPEG